MAIIFKLLSLSHHFLNILHFPSISIKHQITTRLMEMMNFDDTDVLTRSEVYAFYRLNKSWSQNKIMSELLLSRFGISSKNVVPIKETEYQAEMNILINKFKYILENIKSSKSTNVLNNKVFMYLRDYPVLCSLQNIGLNPGSTRKETRTGNIKPRVDCHFPPYYTQWASRGE